jgi:hypothetical protein
MKLYCYIKEDNIDGQLIDGPRALPEVFENVSNFHCLDEQSIISYGWLPYEKVSENKEVFVSSSFEILNDRVIENVVTRDKTDAEKQQDEENNISQQWASVRSRRDTLLVESDKDVVIDKWLLMDEETKGLHTIYRKKLRDIPQDFENPFDVIFPELFPSAPVEILSNGSTVADTNF